MSTIKNVDVIDLLTNTNEYFKLIMVEDREWDSDPSMYEELQEKLNNYLIYFEDGQFENDFPEESNLRKVIQLDYEFEMSETAKRVTDKIHQVLQGREIEFLSNKLGND